jgi:hypothetical protein
MLLSDIIVVYAFSSMAANSSIIMNCYFLASIIFPPVFAQENAEIMRKVLKLIHKHLDAMQKETAVESPMLDDNEVRKYLEYVIRETRGKKDNRTFGV